MNTLRNKLNGPDAMLCHSCRLLAHNGEEPLPPTPMTSLSTAAARCPACDPRGELHGVAPLPELDARREFWYANGSTGSSSRSESTDADLSVVSSEADAVVVMAEPEKNDEGKKESTATTPEKGKDGKKQRRGIFTRFLGKGKGKENSAVENSQHDKEREDEETDPNPPAILMMNLSATAVAEAIAAAAAEESNSSNDSGEKFVVIHDSDDEKTPSIGCTTAEDHEAEPLPGLFRDAGYLSPPLSVELTGTTEASPFVPRDVTRGR